MFDEKLTLLIQLQIEGIEGTSIMFRSRFFAVSGFQLVLVSPEGIDFSSIILQFDERLADSNVVLSVGCGLICVFLISLIILKYADRKDAQKVNIKFYIIIIAFTANHKTI